MQRNIHSEEDAKRTKLSNEGFKEFMQKVGKMRFTSANKVIVHSMNV